MRRKLIQHGLSSLTVALPYRWVKDMGLAKGDEVELEARPEDIIISAKRHQEHKKIEIDVTGADPMIRKMIGATFKAGYDEAIVRFSTHEELRAVSELIRDQFTGFEIMSQSKDRLVIKDVTQLGFEEFDNVLKRFLFVVHTMASETASAVKAKDRDWLKNIALMKIESDKHADYCRRAINLGAGKGRIGPLYTIIEQMEKVADRYTDLCGLLAGSKIDDELASVLIKISEFLGDFLPLFNSFELKKIVRFGRKKLSIQDSIEKVKDRKVHALLDRTLNLIFDLNGPLMTYHI